MLVLFLVGVGWAQRVPVTVFDLAPEVRLPYGTERLLLDTCEDREDAVVRCYGMRGSMNSVVNLMTLELEIAGYQLVIERPEVQDGRAVLTQAWAFPNNETLIVIYLDAPDEVRVITGLHPDPG